MSIYVNTKTGQYPVTEAGIVEANPNTMFPAITPEIAAAFGYAEVVPGSRPTYNAAVQKVETLAPALVDGKWTLQYAVVGLTESEQAAYADSLIAAAKAAVPASVSPRQIRQALTRAGLRTSVEAAVAAGDQDTKDWYEFATQFERSSPIVAALGSALSVTPTQLDDLWTLAGTL